MKQTEQHVEDVILQLREKTLESLAFNVKLIIVTSGQPCPPFKSLTVIVKEKKQEICLKSSNG